MNENSPYLGKWKISEMEEWDQDYINLIVRGYIEFDADHSGAFQFGTANGWLDYRVE